MKYVLLLVVVVLVAAGGASAVPVADVADSPSPQARSEFICIAGGKLACEINCLNLTGHFDSICDENNDCICGHAEVTLSE